LLLSVLVLPQATAFAAGDAAHAPVSGPSSSVIPAKPAGGMLSPQAFTDNATSPAKFDLAAARGSRSSRSLAALPPLEPVQVDSGSAYWVGDYLCVDGIVTNDYTYALNAVQVTVTLKDLSDNVVATQTNYASTYRLAPEEFASFKTMFYLPPDEGSYVIEAVGCQEFDTMPVSLTPGSASYDEDEYGVRYYSQVFRNDSPYTVEQPLVGGWELDAENNLIDTFFDYDDTVQIAPGGSWIGEFTGENVDGIVDWPYAYAEAWPVSYDIASGRVTRVTGASRYDVAASLARKGWDPTQTKAWTGVYDVIITNGENGKEADPLAAAGLAGAYNCPVLLTGTTSLPTATKTILTQIAAANPGVRIHIIGGTGSVPDARWSDIRRIPGISATKDRIAGADRYAVSAAIATRIVKVLGPDAIGGVMLVAGDNPAAFYDALAASPIAFSNSMPMLAVKKGSVPASVNTVLKSAALVNKPRYAASSSYYIAGSLSGAKRLTSSSNRYTAASAISKYAIAQGWSWPSDVGLAAKLPDALTGGTYLGKVGGVMLFTDSSTAIQSASKSFISANSADITNGWVIGGGVSVPVAQETSFRGLLQ